MRVVPLPPLCPMPLSPAPQDHPKPPAKAQPLPGPTEPTGWCMPRPPSGGGEALFHHGAPLPTSGFSGPRPSNGLAPMRCDSVRRLPWTTLQVCRGGPFWAPSGEWGGGVLRGQSTTQLVDLLVGQGTSLSTSRSTTHCNVSIRMVTSRSTSRSTTQLVDGLVD